MVPLLAKTLMSSGKGIGGGNGAEVLSAIPKSLFALAPHIVAVVLATVAPE